MKACCFGTVLVAVVALTAPAVQAQSRGGGGGKVVSVEPVVGLKITESAPIEVSLVKNAPFAAQAVTEFTQTLGDGNRIERRYQSSVARDSRGRTRREEEIALIGPLAGANVGASRLVTIVDPDSGAGYTLDDERRVAYRSGQATDKKLIELTKLTEALKATRAWETSKATTSKGGGRGIPAELKRVEADLQEQATAQDLGFRMVEGVRAQGTRTTTTIAAGAIGNMLPIEIVSERWFSSDLQMPVLITRRDPRNGDTTYRLTNIQRGEQPDALFTVPSGYEVKDGTMKFKLIDSLKAKKLEAAAQR
jgi:regulator of extracellular matrix RemA (YlzA/DUF370 family)